MITPDPRVREHLRERITDLLLEYAVYENGSQLFKHDLTCACRELENYFSKQLHTIQHVRITQ